VDGVRESRIVRLLAHPRATAAVLLSALLFTLPTLAVGFFADDYVLVDTIRGGGAWNPPWYDLYWFIPGTVAANRVAMGAGQLPWWAAAEMKAHFFRPLASALLKVDDLLFGSAPLAGHLHSIGWYIALVAAAGALYRRLLPRATATLALWIFAVCAAHVHPFGWMSARHATVATLFVLLGLLAYVRDCDDGWRLGRWLAAVSLAVGLAAGETAVAAAAYGLAFAVLAPGRAGARGARLHAAFPSLVVLAGYAVVYVLAGAGVAHSGRYLDPLHEPGSFAVEGAMRFPVLLANAILLVPSELALAFPQAPFVAIGIVAALGVAWLLRACSARFTEGERAALRWLLPGTILAIVPTLGGFPGARLLLAPDVGFAAVLAVIVRHGFDAAGDHGLRLLCRRAGAGLLAFVHVVASPLLVLALEAAAVQMARADEDVALGAEIDGPPNGRVFVVAASDPMVGLYPPAVLAARAPGRAACWTNLSGTRAPHTVQRVDASTLAIEPVGATMLGGAFEDLYRSQTEPLRVGDGGVVCGATVRVVALRDEHPARIEVRFDVPLEDPSLRLVAWRDGKLRRFTPPAVGERATLSWSVGPMGIF
jgi:hypothetical protein